MYLPPRPKHLRLFALCATAAGLACLSGCQSFSIPGLKQNKQPIAATSTLPHLENDGLAPAASGTGSTLTDKQRAGVQMFVASQFESSNEPDRAVQAYREVIQKDPECAGAYHRLAILRDKAGKHDESFKLFHDAIRRDPKNPEIHCDLGYSLYLQRRWQDSENSLRRAIALRPNHNRAHNNLGLVLARTDRHQDALREFSQVGCTEAEARANLAHALLLESRWAEAEAQCERALASRNLTPQMHSKLSRLRTVARAEAKVAANPAPQSG